MIYVVYFASAGVPATGLSPSIVTYIKVSDGSSGGSAPSVSELSGGFYKFTASPSESLLVRIDGGTSLANADRYKVMQVTTNDGALDAAITSRSTLTAQQVWEYATRTLSSFGTLVSDIWANSTRTLSSFGTLIADLWANATRTLTAGTRDSQIDAIKAKTDNLPSDPASNTQVNTRLATSGYTGPDNAGIAAIKAKTDNLPAAPAIEGNVQGHVAAALAVYDPPTKVEMEAVVAPLALEAGIEAHVLAVLNSYDPPTRAEATADKAAILTAIAALNDITVGELLAGDLSDSLSFPANSLADRLRKLFWILCNRLVITDGSGAFTAYKTDGVTPAATGTITDNGTNTVRSAPTWP
ncbi:MAG: hypothetical protein A2139_11940 [Desulfobacca sp. RBG_16_60_12]|nr:MAG: hypothetical protein A2139_11940 [Desulfobacca sp. RBG_16_60_12]